LPPDPIIVAGAGIIGASITYHLARRGARVTLVDSQHPGSGATGRSMGWINATFSKRPRAYFHLNQAGIAAWRRMEDELPVTLKVQWGGSVAWFPSGADADALRDNVRHHSAWGYAVRLIDEKELRGLLPNVSPGEIGAACHSELEASVDPLDALGVLLGHARHYGARILAGCEVAALLLEDGRVRAVQTNAGTLEANTVVLAAGVNSPRLAQMAGIRIPLKDSPGVLIHTEPTEPIIDRVVLAPDAHFKQTLDGRIIAGGPIVAGAGTATTEANVDQAREIRETVERYLPQLKRVPTERVTLGYRVMPLDEYPIVGFAAACPNLYVAATHSGVTLAPLIGQLAASEILDCVSSPALQPYRPDRF